MKKFVLSVLCALVSLSAFGQGTIALSNIGGSPVTIDGVAAGPGSATVQYYSNGAPIGGTADILGAGFFSNGSTELDGLTGEVTLQLGGTSADGMATGLSAPFTVTLGGTGTPPAPAAGLPGDVSLNLVTVPEPSTIALAVLGGAALLFRRRK